ncbi:hypothetical protein QYE76_029875 [Lolium multiflorum]|uniref:Protein kinase domain-containing protein n=1 Tax=Lolium multiflorum TaxID=4521 RepID=A0AAD8QPG3_LOLMU|nr:hypothetical protein QYE76_029875 [Lolium multiflorum]
MDKENANPIVEVGSKRDASIFGIVPSTNVAAAGASEAAASGGSQIPAGWDPYEPVQRTSRPRTPTTPPCRTHGTRRLGATDFNCLVTHAENISTTFPKVGTTVNVHSFRAKHGRSAYTSAACAGGDLRRAHASAQAQGSQGEQEQQVKAEPDGLFLGDGTVEVLEISILNSTVRINSTNIMPLVDTDGASRPNTSRYHTWGGLREGGPFFVAPDRNKFLVLSCNNIQVILMGEDNSTINACATYCPSIEDSDSQPQLIRYLLLHGECSGLGCCGGGIPKGYTSYHIQLQPSNDSSFDAKSSVYIAEDGSYNISKLMYEPRDIDECVHKEARSCHGTCENMPGTFLCRCPDGTYGNPAVKGGCIKITNFSAGLTIGIVISGVAVLLLALSAPFVTRIVKLRKVKKRRAKLFNQNHGLLLQQLISQKADIGERMLFTLGDIEKATNNFDKSREVGGGGHGVVYKGILDLHVVAIKKSKIVVQKELDEFINEVAILSQINHRNGCCLEAEVPLLVYEFISNGTLYQHLHVEGPTSLSWDNRLRIALEIARALAYLHSATSVPIFHRDICWN